MNRKNKTRGLSSESEQVVTRAVLEDLLRTQELLLNLDLKEHRKNRGKTDWVAGYYHGNFSGRLSAVAAIAAALGIATQIYFSSSEGKWKKI